MGVCACAVGWAGGWVGGWWVVGGGSTGVWADGYGERV